MEEAVFDPAETIAGFTLVKIQEALTWIGLMPDRDDIANVAEALACPRSQAERVLAALVRRGLVAPTSVKTRWDKTPLGNQLAHRWRRPPRLEPAITRDEDDEGATNEVFDAVPCSLWRSTDNDGEAFEEADLVVGVWVEYASPRVIEVSISIPNDYDNRESSSTIESSVYVGVDEAKRFAAALQTAIERGEAELARRASAKPKRKKPAGEPADKMAKASLVARPTATRPKPTPSPAAAARAVEAAEKAAERAAEKKRLDEKRALDATMKELRGGKR